MLIRVKVSNSKRAGLKCDSINVPTILKLVGYFCLSHVNSVAKSEWQLLLHHCLQHLITKRKDLASEFRYWRQCFNDFCEINKITDAQTLIKLFRSCVGRHIVTYLEDLPNYGQLNTVKQLLDTAENRYKKAVNVHAERLNFRSIGINPGESLLDYESRLNSFSKIL